MNVRFTDNLINIYKDSINIVAFKIDDLTDNDFILNLFYLFIDCVIYDKIECSNVSYRWFQME